MKRSGAVCSTCADALWPKFEAHRQTCQGLVSELFRNCFVLKSNISEAVRSNSPYMCRSCAISPESRAHLQTYLGIVSGLFRSCCRLQQRLLEAVRSHSLDICRCPIAQIRSSPPDLSRNCIGVVSALSCTEIESYGSGQEPCS